MGVVKYFTTSIGFSLFVLIIAVNTFIIRKQFYTPEGKTVLKGFKWVVIFAIFYLFLLPLGGYRPYRPYSIRHDTFIPVMIALLFLYGISTYFLLNNLRLGFRKGYLAGLVLVFAFYTIADHIKNDDFIKERAGLELISKTEGQIIQLPHDYKVMSWLPFSDPLQSEFNSELLKFWRITSEKKLYFNTEQ